MAERSSEHKPSSIAGHCAGELEAVSFRANQLDTQLKAQLGDEGTASQPDLTFDSLPSPSHTSPLKLVHATLCQALPSYAHISCVCFDGEAVFAVLEITAASTVERNDGVGIARALMAKAFPESQLQIRVVEFDRAPDPVTLAAFRTCYFRYPMLQAISTGEKFVECGPSVLSRDRTKDVSSLMTELQPLFGKKLEVRCANGANDEVCPPPPSLGMAAVSARAVALKLWQSSGIKHIGVQWANYFELDLTRNELRLVQEAQALARRKLTQSTAHITTRLLIPNLSVEIVRESSIHDAAAYVSSFIPSEVLHHSISQCKGELRVALLVDSSNASRAADIERQLRKDCSAVGSLLLSVRTVVRNSDAVEHCFRAFPPEWGFHSVHTSADGRAALIASVSGACESPGEEYINRLRDTYPEGIYFNSTRNIPVVTRDPLFQTVFAALPTRCGLRTIDACRVTGDLRLNVGLQPPASKLRELSDRLGVRVTAQVRPTIKPPELIRPAVDLLRAYGGELPFFVAPTTGHSSFLGRGGCQRVGGSRLLLNLSGLRPQLDCGAILARHENVRIGLEDFKDTDLVVVSHGHLDHCGKLAEAVDAGLRVPVIMTEATALVMYPGLVEQSRRNRRLRRAIPELYKLIRVVPYDVPVQLSDSVKMTFLNAGHLLGSAQCLFECTGVDGPYLVLYTGDFRNEPNRLHRKAATAPPVDVIIAEGTYGNCSSPPREIIEAEFLHKVMRTLNGGGSVFLPVLALGRGPEVLDVLGGIRGWLNQNRIPIRVVGLVNGTNDLYKFIASDDPGHFNDEALQTRPWEVNFDCVVRGEKRPGRLERWHKGSGPEIVIAAGGMVSGLEKLLVEYCEDKRNLLLLTCYQAEGLGRKILKRREGDPPLRNLPNFRMQVEEFHLSPGHSSGDETIQFITESAKDAATVLLVHGEKQNLETLVPPLMADERISRVIIPAQDEYIELKPARGV